MQKNEKIILYECNHTNLGEPLVFLFEEIRYDRLDQTPIRNIETLYRFTWSYYECPVCHQILVFRKEDDS